MRRAALCLLALLPVLAACGGAGTSMVDSAFPVSRMGPEGRLAGVDATGFTVQRVLGRPDGLAPLTEDQSVMAREADGRTLRDLLDVDGQRSNVFEQMERNPGAVPPAVVPPGTEPPRPRGSGFPPRAEVPPPREPRVVSVPRPDPSPVPQRTLPPGTVLPGGAVVGPSVGSTAPTIGPSGQSGIATRDGNTVTLFGPDGSIRTVPVPPR
jgi:hypothetical protein